MGARSSQSRGPGLNRTDGHLLEYFRNTFGAGGGGTNPGPASTGLTATGGIINDFTSGSDVYRAHVFTSSGEFEVTAIGSEPANIEYLVVAGGGGGGSHSTAGGGGAGGVRTNLAGHPYATSQAFTVTAGPTTYTVTVGGGGNAGNTIPGGNSGSKGGNSYFGPPSTPAGIESEGGGFGAKDTANGGPGGSGGGAGGSSGGVFTGGSTVAVTTPSPWPGPSVQGTAGGDSKDPPSNPYTAGGGGGAGGAGVQGSTNAGPGGPGIQVLIAGPPSTDQPVGTPGTSPGGGYFAGGGGGASSTYGGTNGTAGQGGGGAGGTSGGLGTYATGGGGGGGTGPTSPSGTGGQGGSGVVVVRYKVGSVLTAKATGGNISFYNGKTIHAFTSTDDFTVTSGSPLTVEYIAIAGGGGGGGGNRGGGGGGAGGIKTNISGWGNIAQTTIPAVGPGAPNKLTVTVGAGGAGGAGRASSLQPGSDASDSSIVGPGPINVAATAGGGGAGSAFPNIDPGRPGGSGGGGSDGPADGSSSAGDGVTSPREGYPGGIGYHSSGNFSAGGGGGGAGGVGGPSQPGIGGLGGVGLQLPSTYQITQSNTALGAPGPGPSSYWVAGGGGGGGNVVNGGAGGGSPTIATPYAGAGRGADQDADNATSGLSNTGAGGGGAAGEDAAPVNPSGPGGRGGSGLVLIAYPT